MDAEHTFGSWLKSQRRERDLTQEDLAERIGCATVTLRKIESNLRKPSRQIAELLAELFEVPPPQRSAFIQAARFGNAPSGAANVPRRSTEVDEYAPSAQRSPSMPSTLPAQLTPLIGRQPDLVATRNSIQNQGTRLLTMVGPPGIGKTRLALALANDLREHFADGVFFVPLATLTDPHLIAPTIAQALGLLEASAQSAVTALHQSLQDKHLLLVLDNFEQLVAGAVLVADLLAACARLVIVVTSRAALQVRGERQFPVAPLAQPGNTSGTAAELMRYPAVALFVERAQAVKHDFELTDDNAPIVAAICARLDGLPLAIELVAARVRILSPRALLTRLASDLAQPFRLSTPGPRDLPERHQTLRQAIGWSYDLLDTDERTLFRRLAVFVGGWTLEAAEAMAAGNEFATLDTIASLINKSLLIEQGDDDEDMRFGMFETIREYATEQLVLNGEERAAREQHAAIYRQLVEQAEPFLGSSEQDRWFDRLQRDHDNIRTTMRWLIDHDQLDAAARIGAVIWRFWFARGFIAEGRAWMEQVAARSDAAPGLMSLDGRRDLMTALSALAYYQSDYAGARPFLEENLQLARASGDPVALTRALGNLGILLSDQGQFAESTALHEEALRIDRQSGDQRGIAFSLGSIGVLAFRQGMYERSRAALEESLAIHRALGDQTSIAITLSNLADVLRHTGDLDAARLLCEEALAVARLIDNAYVGAVCLANLGDIEWSTGALAQARAHYVKALPTLVQFHINESLAGCAEALAELVLMEQPSVERARDVARIYSAIATMRAAQSIHLQNDEQSESDRRIRAVQALVPAATFTAAWQEGQGISLQQAGERLLKMVT